MQTDKDTNTYKIKLEEEKKVLIEELGSLGRIDKTTGDWQATPEVLTTPEFDDNDLADRAEDFEERSSRLVPLEARLNDINAALEAIKNSTYGICQSCGKEIETDRLEANPAAMTCKVCMVNNS